MNVYIANYVDGRIEEAAGFYDIPITDTTEAYFVDSSQNPKLKDIIVDGTAYIGNISECMHSFSAPMFTWSADNTCTTTVACADCGNSGEINCTVTSETILPTDVEDGAIIYTATAEFDGQVFTDTKTIVISATGYLAGDITGDGKLNNRDAARLMQCLAGWDVEYVEPALDVNGDGKVNNRDAARLMQYLAGWDVEIFSATKGEVLDAGVCGNSAIWILYNSGLMEITGTGAMTDYFEMDDEANGLSAPPWDAYQPEITKLVINDGITEIGSHAFRLCTSLTSVTIPKSVTIIGGDAFRHCTALSTVTIPKNVTEIGTYAFSWCESLERVEIYADAVRIIDCAFQDCTSLVEVVFTGDAPEIAERMVFYNVSTVIYYPADNETWTAAIMQNYDGEITWVPYTLGENGEMITVETV